MKSASCSDQNLDNHSVFVCVIKESEAASVLLRARERIKACVRRWDVRFDVRKTLFHLAARVLEDLQRSLCNLLVVHLQTTQQRLECLCGVERHRVCERQHLCGMEAG